MSGTEDGRGILYPAKLPSFHRVLPPPALADRVRWFWIPRWDLAPGRTSRQELLPFPASNLVVDPETVSLAGPAAGASHRDLSGRGWAVGALLRPAGVAALCPDPRTLVGTEMPIGRDEHTAEPPIDAQDLLRSIRTAMDDTDEQRANDNAATAFAGWLAQHTASPDENGLLANALEDLVSSDRDITRVDQLADRLGLTTRAVQRLAERYVGLAPLAIIRRYRLQEAAQRLREDRDASIAQIAADLGYADQAHLSADFRRILGRPPSAYRKTS